MKGQCNFEFDFSEQEWADIKAIAQEIFDSGQFGNNQFKCAIAAFIVYTDAQPELTPTTADIEPGRTLH